MYGPNVCLISFQVFNLDGKEGGGAGGHHIVSRHSLSLSIGFYLQNMDIAKTRNQLDFAKSTLLDENQPLKTNFRATCIISFYYMI